MRLFLLTLLISISACSTPQIDYESLKMDDILDQYEQDGIPTGDYSGDVDCFELTNDMEC